jgi:FtsP/CotA-like multicopper oxidase with cupredoxin domain
MHKNTLIFIGLLVLLVLGLLAVRDKGEKPTVTLAPTTKETQTIDLASGSVYELTASEVTHSIDGKIVTMLAYNDMIPGPTIRVHEGDEVTIRFINKMDIPTLLHSHGIRMDNAFDGSQLTQADILPGERFDYVLKFPDAGVYWYHPHVREDKQQNLGLYGGFVVIPKEDGYWPPVHHEETLFLSDILMEDGMIAPYSDAYVTHALMGRFGNTLLVNGKTNYEIKGEPGEVQRFYVTNSATTRTFNFGIAGAKMKLVGGDNGRYEKETFIESVVLAPSERAVIDVYFDKEGTYAIEHKTPTKTYTLGNVSVSGAAPATTLGEQFMTLRTNKAETDTFMELRRHLGRVPDKTLRLTLTTDMAKIMSYSGAMGGGHDHGGSGMSGEMGGMMGNAEPIEWEDHMGAMNVYSTSDTVEWILKDDVTGLKNMDIDWKFKVGDMVKIRIINDPASMHPMQHPIHFHGNRFAVLSTNGVPNDNIVWKDTTLVRAGDTMDILLEATNVGKWMAHCHIAEHLHSGMMLGYSVE